MKIGIIGNGFVGKATQLFKCNNIEIIVYDIIPNYCIPRNTTIADINACDLIFICVPTPLSITGNCNTDIVEKVLHQLDHPFIVLRSTIPIGYSDKKDCFFMPEFLTEQNWKQDFITNSNWIVGICENCDEQREGKFISLFIDLIENAYVENKIESNRIVFCKNKEAEMTKLIKNSFLANKVSFFNEMYDLAVSLNIDYQEVTQLVGLDDRIGITHMKVPGYMKKRGYGGTCFPKDTTNLYNLCLQNQLNPIIIESTLYRNEYKDRRERDWLKDYGRTTLTSDDTKIILLCGDRSSIMYEKLKLFDDMIIYVNPPIDLDILENDGKIFPVNLSLTQKLFFPRIDKIYYYKSHTVPKEYKDLQVSANSMMNIIELSELHNCPLIFDGDSYSKILYDAYKKKNEIIFT